MTLDYFPGLVSSALITPSPNKPSSTSLNALEGQSPQLRKNVMAATVSVFAMPTIATFLAPIATVAATAIPAALATQSTVQWLVNKGEASDPLLLGGIFVVHWFITNIVLQKFKDVGEE